MVDELCEDDFISAVLDTVGALIVVLDRGGRIIRFNRACERTTGFTFDEVRGRPLWDRLLVPEEVGPVKAVFHELRAGQFPNEFENHWVTKDGGRRLIAWSNTALLDGDGTVAYVIGTGIDVTEQRGAQRALEEAYQTLEQRVAERTAALQQAEGHVRSLMESARTYAVYRVALDRGNPFLGRVILASPSMKELLGIPDLADFATWFDGIHPEDRPRIVEANRRSLETGIPFDEQFRVCRQGEEDWAWVHVRSTPVVKDGGEVDFNGLVVDITEQKRAEEEVRRQNAYLAALHETTLGVVSRLETGDLLEAIVERATELVDAPYGFIYLVRPDTDEIEVRVGTGPYRQYVGRRLRRGEGLSGSIWESRQPLAVEDYQAWPERSPQFEGVSFGPAMGTPLMSGGEVTGVIGVARPSGAPLFRPDEIALITRFGHLASIALDNAHLHTALQEELVQRARAKEALQALVEFEDAIARISGSFVNLAPEEVDEGICRALQVIGEAYHVERGYVFQFSGDPTRMACTHEWCAEGIDPRIAALQDVATELYGWTVDQIRRLHVVQIADVSDLPAEAQSERAELELLGLRSRIVVPMVYREVPMGFVGLDGAQIRRWTEQSLKLQVLGDILVNALEHRRAQTIQAGQRQFLELLATGGGFSETLRTLVHLIEDQWPGMLGLILLLDEDEKHLHIGAAVSLSEDYLASIEGLEIGPLVGSCGTACYRRERVIVEDILTDPRWDGLRDLAVQHGLRACWSEPVLAPTGQVVGTFAMYYRQPRAPTEGELRAIEMGAHLVGIAIEHKRAEGALRESEAKFRSIVEYANVGLAIVQEARFGFLNPHYAAMMGYGVEELIGTEFMGYCAPEERDRVVDLYTRRGRGEPVPSRYETTIMHKNGSRVYVEVSAGVITYEGQPATFVFLRDVTEQKRAQRALEEAYQTLEQRVEERTRELAVLNAVAAVVSASLDLRTIIGAALDESMDAMKMAFGSAYCSEGSAMPTLFRLVAYRGVSVDSVPITGDWWLPEEVAALARSGEPRVWHVEDLFPPGSDVAEYLAAEGCRQMVTLPLIAKGELVGVINLGTGTPRTLTAEDLALLAAVGQQVGMAVENARLYEGEQERLQETEGRRRVAEGMREILAVLNSRRSLSEILDFIAAQTCRLLGSDAAAILRLEDGMLRIRTACGLDPDSIAGMAMQVGEGAAGRAVATGQPIIVSDLAAAAGVTPREILPSELQQGDLAESLLRLLLEFSSVLSVPLVVQGQDYGAITIYYRQPRDFSDEDLRLAMSVADQAALAVESARLREQVEQTAAQEERGRLARELHDSVTQSLYSVTMYTEAAARLMSAGQTETAAEYLRDARDTAQEALREMRLLIYELRPPALEKGGLGVALQVRLDAVERRGGIRADLMVDGQDQLPLAIQAELYQIAQEALNNALKHAHAHAVQVRLTFGPAATCLQIQDDGVGFDLGAAGSGGGLGLPGMRERAQRAGGRLRIESAPGQGTTVWVEVPSGGGR